MYLTYLIFANLPNLENGALATDGSRCHLASHVRFALKATRWRRGGGQTRCARIRQSDWREAIATTSSNSDAERAD